MRKETDLGLNQLASLSEGWYDIQGNLRPVHSEFKLSEKPVPRPGKDPNKLNTRENILWAHKAAAYSVLPFLNLMATFTSSQIREADPVEKCL